MADTVGFELADRRGRLAAVRLQQEVGLPEPLDLTRTGRVWAIEVERPDVDRMEYLFDIEDHNGRRASIVDPANPLRVGGAFGDKSVREFPEYRRPEWLVVEPVAGTQSEREIAAPELDGPVGVTVWAPADLDPARPAPLVVAHDGPEYAALGGLTHYLGAMVATRTIPPTRAALLDPGDRNDSYAANPAYAETLMSRVVPELTSLATTRVGLGASLGALAMLHAHRVGAGPCAGLDALLLQSGSFFTAEHDPQESGFRGFASVSGFVRSVAAADADPHPVPTVLTCGSVEENLANNRAMARELSRLGYPAELVVVRDAHNYTAWRDALHPHLARLLTTTAGVRAA